MKHYNNMKRYVIRVLNLNEENNEDYFIKLYPYLMHVWIARDSFTLKHKRYGFIEFYNEEDMNISIDDLKKKKIKVDFI
jgi:RNA recognition motif-containing protein